MPKRKFSSNSIQVFIKSQNCPTFTKLDISIEDSGDIINIASEIAAFLGDAKEAKIGDVVKVCKGSNKAIATVPDISFVHEML